MDYFLLFRNLLDMKNLDMCSFKQLNEVKLLQWQIC